MKQTLLLSLLLIAWGNAQAGLDSYLATDQIASWNFMQSAGGIRVGVPRKTGSAWTLPVDCDVSGLSTITQKPTATNSGLVITKMLHQRTQNKITISVAVNTALTSDRTTRCTDIVIGGIAAGQYKIFYKESSGATYPLGTVMFE